MFLIFFFFFYVKMDQIIHFLTSAVSFTSRDMLVFSINFNASVSILQHYPLNV